MQTFLQADVARPSGWSGRPLGPVLARRGPGDRPGRAGRLPGSVLVRADPLDVFPRRPGCAPGWSRPSCCAGSASIPAGPSATGIEFAGLRPYEPGDQLRDVNRAVSIRRGQLHVNQRAAARAADLVMMIDTFGESGPVADRAAWTWPCTARPRWTTAYLRVSDRAGLVVLGGVLRWLGPAAGDRQFYRIAEMMLKARYDSFVTPDIGRIPRTALPPGTLVVVFSPLLDPRAFGAADRPAPARLPADRGGHTAGRAARRSRARRRRRLALRLWRLDRAATRSALRHLGVPVLRWPGDAELDSVLAPLRRPPPGLRRLAARS